MHSATENEADITRQIASFAEEQQWMHNIGLPHGIFTRKPSSISLSIGDTADARRKKIKRLQRRGSQEGLLCALEISQKSVLDIACGEGKYTFAVAPEAKRVLGIDIDERRIRKANYIKSLSKYQNIEFSVIDVYGEEFLDLPKFDMATCFGIIHRLPDIFNFINILSEKTDLVLFEWVVAPGLISQNVPWAFHRSGGLYEAFNARSNFEDRAVAAKARAGGGVRRVSYWNISFGGLEAICHRAGLVHFIRFSRTAGYPDLSEDTEKMTRRVMLLASKRPVSVLGRASQEGLREWR